MENFSTVDLTRRNFVKGALATVGAVALATAAPAVKPFAAFADDATIAFSDITDTTKTYTMTANLYVRAKFNAVLGIDAYLTNLTAPKNLLDAKPTTPVTFNATLSFDGATPVVTISQLNTVFGLTSIAGTSDDGGATASGTSIAWSTGGGEKTRLQPVVFKITDTSRSEFEFDATEYADFDFARGDKAWPVTLQIDWDAIKVNA